MLKSLRSFVLLAAAAVAASLSAAARAVAEAPAYVADARRYVIQAVWSIVIGPPMQAAEAELPVVPIVRAKAFVARLGRRDRPVISTRWRMCPSC